MIRVLILAAGESRRMGQAKMLLPFPGGDTILETVVRAALASSADNVTVVLGAMEEKIREAIDHLPVAVAHNKDYRLGMLSSIQCGIRGLPRDTRAAVIMLGDQPTIPMEVIDRVIEAWRLSGKGFVLPTHGGRRGHPLLLDMRYREEVLLLDPAAGMRFFLAAHGEDILEIPVDTSAVLKDVDTPEDYAELVAGKGCP